MIELLIVLTIVGILASLAMPAWQASLTKVRRGDATEALQRLAARQELFRLQHQRYATADELSTPPPDGLGLPGSEHGHYTLSTQADASGYTATARARRDGLQQHDEHCWEFSIDAAGKREARTRTGGGSTRDCWPA